MCGTSLRRATRRAMWPSRTVDGSRSALAGGGCDTPAVRVADAAVSLVAVAPSWRVARAADERSRARNSSLAWSAGRLMLIYQKEQLMSRAGKEHETEGTTKLMCVLCRFSSRRWESSVKDTGQPQLPSLINQQRRLVGSAPENTDRPIVHVVFVLFGDYVLVLLVGLFGRAG